MKLISQENRIKIQDKISQELSETCEEENTMVYSRIRKITFLYVFGATDSERKRGTTNYRKMNRQKKKACFSSSIMGKGPKGGLRPM